jgi:hypothetical protein
MKMANTAVVIARCIAGNPFSEHRPGLIGAIPSFRDDARSRRLMRHPDSAPSLSFKSGRSGSKIGPYSQLRCELPLRRAQLLAIDALQSGNMFSKN